MRHVLMLTAASAAVLLSALPAAAQLSSPNNGRDIISNEQRVTGLRLGCEIASAGGATRLRVANNSGLTIPSGAVLVVRDAATGEAISAARVNGNWRPGGRFAWRADTPVTACLAETANR